MTKDLLKFLFEDSQEETNFEGLLEDLASVERLEIKKQPLVAALKSLDIDTAGLELSPAEGYRLTFLDTTEYNAVMTRLSSPDGVNALAELGWVVANGGNNDGPGTMELPEMHIKFLEVNTPEPSDGSGDVDLEKLQQHMITTGMAGDVGNIGESELPDPVTEADKKNPAKWPNVDGRDNSEVKDKDPLPKTKVPNPDKVSFGVKPK